MGRGSPTEKLIEVWIHLLSVRNKGEIKVNSLNSIGGLLSKAPLVDNSHNPNFIAALCFLISSIRV
jgi:hypothetical protein